MTNDAFSEELDRLIRARYTLLYVVTWEEGRAMRMLMRITEGQRKPLYEWSITNGLRCVHGPGGEGSGSRTRDAMQTLNEILQKDGPAIYVLKDFHAYLESPEMIRQVRDLGHALGPTKKTVVLLSPVLKLPRELEKDITILDLPLPTYDDLSQLLDDSIGPPSSARKFRVRLTPEDRDALIKAAQGLTLKEAENAFAQAIVRDNVLDAQDIQAVVSEKRQVIRKSGLLEYYDIASDMADVGGMDILKDWLDKRVRAFSGEARDYGLPQPRGILLMGVQGCGKSLLAKTIAKQWQLPLLRMDMSMIFQGYIGSSEQNMRNATKVAESLAPVVLWIDEIEKAFSGVEGSGSSDAGTTARVVGTFLTWVQEKTTPVFVVATANEVRDLPPELLRKGRLDEIFFVDLPRSRERAEILAIHLRKIRREPMKFELHDLVNASKGFSGAEIEQAIIAGLHESFFDGRELETRDILKALNDTVPLSRTMREKIEELRMWARDRARPVTTGPRTSAALGTDE